MRVNIKTEVNGSGKLTIVSIETERLSIRPLDADNAIHRDGYIGLFSDPEVMKTFAQGKSLDKENVDAVEKFKAIVQEWALPWKQGDYFGDMVILLDEQFVGRIALRKLDAPGFVDLSYLVCREYWGKGIATEAVSAVVNEYANYIEGLSKELGFVFEGITASVRTDNPASARILEKVGLFREPGDVEKYGATRHLYRKTLHPTE
jgi:ribosomal-protein-alanine N-acetyltransferase